MNISIQKWKLGAIVILVASLISCGGGDNNGNTLATGKYTGKTSEAEITATSIKNFDANTVTSTGLVKIIKSDIMPFNKSPCVSGKVLNKFTAVNTAGEFSGSVTYFKCLNANGIIFDGLIVISGKKDPVTDKLERLALNFKNVTIKENNSELVLNGEFNVVNTTSEKITANLVVEDKITGATYKLENFVFEVTVTTDKTMETISGKYYDSTKGYVTIITDKPLVTMNGATYPESGIIRIIGASKTLNKKATIEITYQPGNNYILRIDFNGDGTYEVDQNCNWSQACNIAAVL
ncbi:MAG: hypothetical protein ACC657_06935 [Thiohalomonadales bacterium]